MEEGPDDEVSKHRDRFLLVTKKEAHHSYLGGLGDDHGDDDDDEVSKEGDRLPLVTKGEGQSLLSVWDWGWGAQSGST